MTPPKNLWPVAIILTFTLFISGTVGLLVMACSQKEDLVSSNYYEQELKFQGQLDRLNRAGKLSAQLTVTFDRARQGIAIALPADQARQPVSGRIQLYRPSSADLDQDLELKPDAAGLQFLDARRLRSGLWKVRISWSAGGQDFFTEQKVVVTAKAS
ncbi:MAG TPA: FixH family protein [Verrucomicrobiae bacterium]|nr:FixH family protein [Verrucomicrobiae bacterium]